MLKLASALALVGLLTTLTGTDARGQCDSHGTARWPVKTSAISTADNDAHTILAQDFVQAPDLNISANEVPNDSFISQDVQIGAETVREGNLVLIRGYLSDVRCEANDGDYHGDFRPDDTGSGPCAEVEVPYPENISDVYTRGHVQNVRTAFDQWLSKSQTEHVTLIGQLFYDETHHSSGSAGGGRGKGHCAGTLWEIHPVLKVFMLQ
jgi:hypothetical protein